MAITALPIARCHHHLLCFFLTANTFEGSSSQFQCHGCHSIDDAIFLQCHPSSSNAMAASSKLPLMLQFPTLLHFTSTVTTFHAVSKHHTPLLQSCSTHVSTAACSHFCCQGTCFCQLTLMTLEQTLLLVCCCQLSWRKIAWVLQSVPLLELTVVTQCPFV